MSQVYTSITAALKVSESHLVSTSKDFCAMLKLATSVPATHETPVSSTLDKDALSPSYVQCATSKKVHHSTKKMFINKTYKVELRLIRMALSSPWISMSRPIGHFIPRDPIGKGWADSCLNATGGFSIDVGCWWYIEWPEQIYNRMLWFVKNNKYGTLISINVLEYAVLIINSLAATYYFLKTKYPLHPYPSVLL